MSNSNSASFTPHFPPAIDSTMLSAMGGCWRKFYNTYCRGISSPQESEHLIFGGAVADGLRAARLAYYAQGKSEQEALEAAIEVGLSSYTIAAPDGSVKSPENVVIVLEQYLSRDYPLSQDEYVPYRMSEGGAPFCELSFAIPLPIAHPETGEAILFAGRSDMVGVSRRLFGEKPWEATEVWVMDEKTTSQMGAKWAQQWRMRGQFHGYTWAAQMHNIPATGAIIRGICIRKTRDPEMQQFMLPIPQPRIDRWYQTILHRVQEAVTRWQHQQWDQDFGDACSAYGGCGYIDICEIEDASAERFLETTFVDRRWDPLRQLEKSA